jgi:hypothetical protein
MKVTNIASSEISAVSSWDPARAAEADDRARKDRRYSEEIQESLEKMVGTSMVERTVRVQDDSGNSRRLTIPRYVGWLAEQADLGEAKVERFGGRRAVQTYEHRTEGVPDAGEIPHWYDPQPNTGFFPTLP